MHTVTGTVTRVIRHGHTLYGNPTMSIVLKPQALAPGSGIYVPSDPDWTLRISDNAGMVYEIENREFRETPHTFALTRSGRISHVIR